MLMATLLAPAASDFISSLTKEKKVDVDIIFGKHYKLYNKVKNRINKE